MEINLNFCDEFYYPKILKDIISKIVYNIMHIANKDIISIAITGSGGRGELSYMFESGSLLLFSDIEFLVITKELLKKYYIDEINSRIRNIEIELYKNCATAHIDIGFVPIYKLKFTKYSFFLYETKKTGKTIYGKEIGKLLQDKKISNNVSILTLYRLLYPILYYSNDFNYNPIKKMEFEYAIVRTALDLPISILNQENIFISGYKDRNIALRNIMFKNNIYQYFPTWFLDYVDKCLLIKMNIGSYVNEDIEQLYERLVTSYRYWIEYNINKNIKEKYSSNGGLEVLKAIKSDIKPSYLDIIKLFRDIIFLLKNFKSFGSFNEMFSFLNRDLIIINVIWLLNLVLLNIIKNDTKRSEGIMNIAENYFKFGKYGIDKQNKNSLVNRFLLLREEVINYLCKHDDKFINKKYYYTYLLRRNGLSG